MADSRREKEKREQRKSDALDWANDAGKAYRPTCIALPNGMDWYKLDKEEERFLDVIPFLAGWGNPRADEGMPYWMREYYQHRLPTLDGKDAPYPCLFQMYKRRC